MSGQIIRVMVLKSRAMYGVGGGRGGGLSKKKDFGNSPCKVLMVGVRIEFFNLAFFSVMYLSVSCTMYFLLQSINMSPYFCENIICRLSIYKIIFCIQK